MIVLWILLGILILPLLLLCLPVHILVRYGDTIEITVRLLCFRFKIPAEQDKATDDKPAKAEKTASPKKEEKKANPLLQRVKELLSEEGFGGFMRLVGRFMKLTATRAVRIVRCFHIRQFDLYVVAGGTDAAQAAILYGQACATVYPAAEILFRLTKCKEKRISVDLDYALPSKKVQCTADAVVHPILLVHHALQYVFRALPTVLRFVQSPNRKTTQTKVKLSDTQKK